ncbi:Protein PHYTOCHROME KINASE SUBSTRATE 2 [Linum grandiflorum]
MAAYASPGSSRNRDGSFSSYLDSSEETFIRRLAESNALNIHHKKESEDEVEVEVEGEIGVFSAEKYFNGRIDDVHISTTPRRVQEECKKENIIIASDAGEVKFKSGTPSLKSESSWNSHSQLLKGPFRKNSSRKGLFYGLTCRCYCSGRDSIDVKEEAVGEISFRGNPNPDRASPEAACRNLHSLQKKKEACFSFPTTRGTVLSGIHEPNPTLMRKSIDFFGFPVNLKGNAKPAEEADNESDASSDLFEIESVTGRVTPFLAGQASDVPSGCVTPIYAPSEASIDWSVVTASIADFSILSDQEGFRPHSPRPRRRSGGGSFLGCKSGESVRVANDSTTYRARETYKTKPEVDTREFRNSDSFPRPTVRVQAQRKLPGFIARNMQHHPVSSQSRPHSFSPPNTVNILELHR